MSVDPQSRDLAEDIARGAELLRAGRLVAFPTETVYGLGADASNPAALERIFAVKGRPRSHPLIVHLGNAQWLDEWAIDVPPSARALAARFWPGPLTLILKRAPHVPDAVTGGQDTIGLRVPSHPIAHALLDAFGRGIAAPSANRFGRVSPTTADHVRADLGHDVDLVIDGGPCAVGIESTIVDLSRGAPVVLRPGAIAADAVRDVARGDVGTSSGPAPRVPGALAAHYAPRTPLELVASGDLDGAVESRARRGALAVLAFERPHALSAHVELAPRDPAAYAQMLYATLRRLDALGVTAILVEAPPDEPAWAAVNDRLRRAAHR